MCSKRKQCDGDCQPPDKCPCPPPQKCDCSSGKTDDKPKDTGPSK